MVRVGPTLEDVMNFYYLLLCGDVKATGVMFGEEDQEKLERLIFAIGSSKVGSTRMP